MRSFLVILAILNLIPSGCSNSGNKPIAGPVTSLVKLDQSVQNRESKVSASLEASEYAAGFLEPSTTKDAVIGSIQVGRSWAGPATDADRAEFMALVNKAMALKLGEAKAGWDKSRQEASSSSTELAALKIKVAEDTVRAQANLDARIKEIQDQADKERKHWITLVTMGFGSIAIAAGVAMFFLQAQLPFLGPRIAFATIAAGITLIATGIAVNSIERALEAHPWIVYTGLGTILALGLVAGSLAYSNYLHHKDATTK